MSWQSSASTSDCTVHDEEYSTVFARIAKVIHGRDHPEWGDLGRTAFKEGKSMLRDIIELSSALQHMTSKFWDGRILNFYDVGQKFDILIMFLKFARYSCSTKMIWWYQYNGVSVRNRFITLVEITFKTKLLNTKSNAVASSSSAIFKITQTIFLMTIKMWKTELSSLP